MVRRGSVVATRALVDALRAAQPTPWRGEPPTAPARSSRAALLAGLRAAKTSPCPSSLVPAVTRFSVGTPPGGLATAALTTNGPHAALLAYLRAASAPPPSLLPPSAVARVGTGSLGGDPAAVTLDAEAQCAIFVADRHVVLVPPCSRPPRSCRRIRRSRRAAQWPSRRRAAAETAHDVAVGRYCGPVGHALGWSARRAAAIEPTSAVLVADHDRWSARRCWRVAL